MILDYGDEKEPESKRAKISRDSDGEELNEPSKNGEKLQPHWLLLKI